MVNDELNRNKWVDDFRVATEFNNGVTHAGQVDDCWHASEVLHKHTLWIELDFLGIVTGCFTVGIGIVGPVDEGFDFRSVDGNAVFVAEQVLKEHLDGERKAGNLFLVESRCFQRVNLIRCAIGLKLSAGAKTVGVLMCHIYILPDWLAT